MHVIITGYYKKQNYGDDLFEIIAKKIWESKEFKKKVTSYKILPIDKITLSENRTPLDRVILFGGETLNDYFLDKLIELWRFNKNIKFNAIGVSCNQNYNDILNKLHIFESIGFRSKKDYNHFKTRIDSFYCPDIVFSLNRVVPRFSLRKKKYVGFFLSQTSVAHLNRHHEHEYLLSIANFIRYLISINYKICLFPMCTNEKQQEDDNIINIKLLDLFSEHEKHSIRAFSTNKKILTNLKKLKYAICWRYHAHVLCIINNIPFVSISTTPKVKDLLTECQLESLNCDYTQLKNKFDENVKNTKNIQITMNKVYSLYNKQTIIYNDFSIYFKNKIENTIYIEPKNFLVIYEDIVNKYNVCKENDNNDFNTRIITFYFTKSIENDYNFGLSEKIHMGMEKLRGDIYWLINDCILNKNLFFYDTVCHLFGYKYNLDGKINIRYINQNDYKGLHRSGWQYVVDNLENYHGTNGIICDLYLDRTFHWNYTEYKKIGVIPYVKPWIGFIHHTTDVEYTSYNTINLFKNKLFLTSLIHCKGLFVLSEDLKSKIEKILYDKNIKINIYSLTHPTEFVGDNYMFSMKKFMINKNKKIIQIGAWMRNIDAINRLNLGKNKLLLNKYALRGKKMDNYYYEDDISGTSVKTENVIEISENSETYFGDDDNENENENENEFSVVINRLNSLDSNAGRKSSAQINTYRPSGGSISRDQEPRQTILKDNVNLLKYLDNNEYDNLLSENIVFINLIGASAVNTLIECVVRNTPIIINRLPSIVEILGDKYPLFYDNITEVHDLLKRKSIESAHSYLKNLNKDKFHIEHFNKEFMNIVNNL
jgi:hypothetical protein